MKKDKKKFWFFYIIDKQIADEHQVFVNDIYAYTDDPELAENFISTRNMSIFYMKTKKLTDSDMKELFRHYMIFELELFEGTTRNKKYHVKKFSIALTRRERQIVQAKSSVILHENVYHFVWNNIAPFKNKYIKALKTILYLDLRKYISDGDSGTEGYLYSNDLTIILENYRDLFIKSGDMYETI